MPILFQYLSRKLEPCFLLSCPLRCIYQVTLVITDVEGSTELWEWDYAVMTLAQEVHDSVMRSLIGR